MEGIPPRQLKRLEYLSPLKDAELLFSTYKNTEWKAGGKGGWGSGGWIALPDNMVGLK